MDPNQTSQPQQPNPTSTPVNPSNKSKIVPIGLVVIIVLVIAIGAYILGAKQSQPAVQNAISPTPLPTKASATEGVDETANWRTYSDFRGFSFQYSSDRIFNGSRFEYEGNLQGELSIVTTGYLCESCENLSESEFFNSMFKYRKIGDGGAGTTIEQISETKVGDKRAIVFLSHSTDYKEGKPGDKHLVYYVYLNNPKFQVLSLVFYYNDGYKDKDSLLSTFNQILSTFKFLDQDKSDEITNWKIYENDRLGFSFKYPLEWSLDKITEDGLQINHPPKERGFQQDFNSVKWYKNYRDVESTTGFRYDSQIKKWGTTVYQDIYAGTGAHFKELKILTTTDSGAPIYCLNNEGSSDHLISLSNVYIVVDTERCIQGLNYPGYEVFLFKVLQSFSVIR